MADLPKIEATPEWEEVVSLTDGVYQFQSQRASAGFQIAVSDTGIMPSETQGITVMPSLWSPPEAISGAERFWTKGRSGQLQPLEVI